MSHRIGHANTRGACGGCNTCTDRPALYLEEDAGSGHLTASPVPPLLRLPVPVRVAAPAPASAACLPAACVPAAHICLAARLNSATKPSCDNTDRGVCNHKHVSQTGKHTLQRPA